MESRGNKLFDWTWFLSFAVASTIWCLLAARALGPTYDEPFYLQAGLERWHTGSYARLLGAGTMPLPIDVETLPVYLWEWWQGTTFTVDDDLHSILPLARMGTLVFWWVLLLYGRLIGRALAGPWAGRLAVALLAVEPSLLAHASLATTDLAISACLLALTYHFWKNRQGRWLWRVGLPALCFGLAVLAKASGLVFGSLCLLVIECQRLDLDGRLRPPAGVGWWAHVRQTLWPSLRDLFSIGILGMVLVFLYCGSDWQQQPRFLAWATQLPEGTFRDTMVWAAENLHVFPNAAEGIARQVKHNLHGHSPYLLGVEHDRAVWFYFPVLLLIKLSVGLLMLAASVILARPKGLANWAGLCFLALLGVSFTFRVQIGIRMILPMVALGMIGLSSALVQACQTWGESWRRTALGLVAIGCLIWTAAVSARLWPHGLCFVNELWGGTWNGYWVVNDSNYDWGQGLADLEHWRCARQVDRLDVWYFGTDPREYRLPLRSTPYCKEPVATAEEFHKRVAGRYLAVSMTYLHGSYAKDAEVPRQVLRSMRPCDRTQTFLIYDFTRETTTAQVGP